MYYYIPHVETKPSHYHKHAHTLQTLSEKNNIILSCAVSYTKPSHDLHAVQSKGKGTGIIIANAGCSNI